MPISEYMRRLRERVGHELLLVPSAAAVIRDERGRLLLVSHAASSGLWGLPGGAVDPDERPAETAVRETREETGLKVEAVRLLTVVGGPGCRFTYPNGDEVSYVASVYECRVVGGDERPDGEEILELGWFAIRDAAKLRLTPSARAVVAELA